MIFTEIGQRNALALPFRKLQGQRFQVVSGGQRRLHRQMDDDHENGAERRQRAEPPGQRPAAAKQDHHPGRRHGQPPARRHQVQPRRRRFGDRQSRQGKKGDAGNHVKQPGRNLIPGGAFFFRRAVKQQPGQHQGDGREFGQQVVELLAADGRKNHQRGDQPGNTEPHPAVSA